MTEIRKGTFLFHRLILPVSELKIAFSVSLSVHWERIVSVCAHCFSANAILTANGQMGRLASDSKNLFVQIMLRPVFLLSFPVHFGCEPMREI